MKLCRHMVKFCESYLRSVAIKSTADFKKTAESQTDKFTHFEVSFEVVYAEIVNEYDIVVLCNTTGAVISLCK